MTILVEIGQITATGSTVTIRCDTPVGFVTVTAAVTQDEFAGEANSR